MAVLLSFDCIIRHSIQADLYPNDPSDDAVYAGGSGSPAVCAEASGDEMAVLLSFDCIIRHSIQADLYPNDPSDDAVYAGGSGSPAVCAEASGKGMGLLVRYCSSVFMRGIFSVCRACFHMASVYAGMDSEAQ